MDLKAEDEIAQVKMQHPHVVIVGAGASRAAFPEGERCGRRLPLMCDFAEIVPVQGILEGAGLDWQGRNFEDVYAELAEDPNRKSVRLELERAVYEYFASLGLPDTPTIYDHLVLSLRNKDVIATFNWDPFLIQAFRRNSRAVASLPRLLFLHGNVLAGHCLKDEVLGVSGNRCSQCGKPFEPSRLLYPVANKSYRSDPMIASTWHEIEIHLRSAFMVTVFGYGAPASDAAAIELLSTAWGRPEDRYMEQVEIIDIKPEDELGEAWDRFINTHHYEVHTDFYESWIATHPRRTGEAYLNQYIDACFIEENAIPKTADLPTLWRWLRPLLQAERVPAQDSDHESK